MVAYHPSGPSSLARALRELQATFTAGGDLSHKAHTFLGASRTAGANALALELKAFRSAPTAAALQGMWRTLEATRAHMIADGLLPTDAFAADVVDIS